MGSRRVTIVVLLAVLAVPLLATPAAAQSVNRDLIDQLNRQLLYVALPLTAFVEIILLYAVFRFRDNPDPKPTAEDPMLEVTWTAATAVILLFVGFSAYTVLGSPYVSPTADVAVTEETADVPENAVVVDVIAYQWGWEFRYPSANVTAQGELVVPTNREVYLRLTSKDVVHSFFVSDWGVKQDVFPGRTTVIHTRVYEPGRYQVYCTELCGVGHSRMQANATAVAPDRYRAWLDEHRGESGVTTVPQPPYRNETATPA